jgi:trimeric autotransporter adhesin
MVVPEGQEDTTLAIYGTQGDDEIHAYGWLEEIWGLGGDDTIYAGWSHNDVIGGSGDDILYGESGNDALYGQEDDDTLYGGDHQDFLYGQDGNDILNGGGGAFNDVMEGGRGNDIYYVDYVGDVVDEVAGDSDGTDRVKASIDYTLPDRVENLTLLQGAGAIDGTGNGLDNEIIGNSSSNTLTGLDGSDTLDGGGGADDMHGGRDDDYYYVDNAGDVVTENADEGIDTVYSTVSFTLGDNFEDLGLTGPGEIDGTGNALDNTIAGNGNDNVLRGLDGEDVLKGGGGADTLRGGDENDELHGQAGDDILRGDAGDDEMYGGIGDDDYFVNSNGDEVVEYTGEGHDTVFVSGLEGYTLLANFEDLVLVNVEVGTGNASNNTITGNTRDNYIDGRGGQDTMEGRQGDDTYAVDQANDIVREFAGQGNDTVRTSVNYTLGTGVEIETLMTTVDYGTAAIELTGNEFANTLIGNNGANLLRGRGGSDVIDGRGGIDTVNYFDSSAGAIVVLGQNGAPGQAYELGVVNNQVVLTGLDTLLNVENVQGSNQGDTLVGNELINQLQGFAGNDIYVVQNPGDTIIEGAGQGADELRTSVNYALAAVNADIETFRTTEDAGTAPIDLTGNGIVNFIIGNAGNNEIDGGGGGDRIVGGRGVDTLIGNTGGDTFIWRETNETGTEANFADVIVDFNFVAGDRIDVSQIDANLVDGDNQQFQFIGQNAFTPNTATPDPSDVVPGQIRYVHANGDTLIQLQTGTSADVEAVIRISGIVTPEASWFVL